MKNDTIVYLSLIDAERFKSFLKHYDTFTFLLQRKVFEQKAAGITINFDANGVIGSITRADVLYLSNKQFDNVNSK